MSPPRKRHSKKVLPRTRKLSSIIASVTHLEMSIGDVGQLFALFISRFKNRSVTICCIFLFYSPIPQFHLTLLKRTTYQHEICIQGLLVRGCSSISIIQYHLFLLLLHDPRDLIWNERQEGHKIIVLRWFVIQLSPISVLFLVHSLPAEAYCTSQLRPQARNNDIIPLS